MNLVKEYDYSNTITEQDQKNVIKLVDYLIKSGNWDKNPEKPKFQTHKDLFLYKELEIFKKTFLHSCSDYLRINNRPEYEMFMWCYRDNIFQSHSFMRRENDLWHSHSEYEGRISGVYYLRNLRNEGTEFENFKINAKPFMWYLYPSYLLHKPPKTKSFRNRYTIAADLWK